MDKSTKKRVIFNLAAIVAAFAVVSAVLGVVIAFYHEVYKIPANIGGVMDAEGYDLSTHHMDAYLYGDWEFFYNKWIVTDEYEGEPDAMLAMPGYWTGGADATVKFEKTAYASYRMEVENLAAGLEIILTMYSCPVAYRTFINGELCTVSGTVTKDVKTSVAAVEPQKTIKRTVPPDGRAVIVLEIAETGQGGIMTALSIRALRENPSMDILFNFAYVSLGIMIAVAVFDFILNLAFLRENQPSLPQFSSSFLLLSVLIHFLTSKEFYLKIGHYLNLNYYSVQIANYLTGILMLIAFVFHLYAIGQLSLHKKGIFSLSAVAAICVLGYFLLEGYAIRILPTMLSVGVFGYLFWGLSKMAAGGIKYSGVSIALLYFMMGLLFAEILDNLGIIIVAMETIVSAVLMLFMTVVLVNSFMRTRDSAAAAVRGLKMEREIMTLKQAAYKAQVNPHFIFNVLSSIESIYRTDLKQGEMALENFASHLRRHIESGNRDLIPFEDELKSMIVYIELENLRYEKPLEVLFDIEHQDFDVPLLALQPLVENAVRYAGITKKPDGYIKISSERSKDNVIRLSILDNGNGFDPSNIRLNATGIRNTKERFKLLLGAEMTIKSGIGEGTEIIITWQDRPKPPPVNRNEGRTFNTLLEGGNC